MSIETTGTVFDLQRFCTHDGPGIRSVLFLKGCPLRCLWCHNPESISTKPQLQFKEHLCVGCNACQNIISAYPDPVKEYKAINDDYSKNEDTELAELCQICPYGAWEKIGRTVTVAEIMPELLADKDYFQSSGGGVTISGGELMLQSEFSLELLQELKKNGIHTAVETSGASNLENYRRLAPYIDVFLWDYKMTNPILHDKFIGRDNKDLLYNLLQIARDGNIILLRCIYLKNIHDRKHWDSLITLYHDNPSIQGVKILPLHNLAADKYKQLGKPYPEELTGQEPEPEDVLEIENYLKENGVIITDY